MLRFLALTVALVPVARAQDVCPPVPEATYEQVGETLVIRGRPSRPAVVVEVVEVPVPVPVVVTDVPAPAAAVVSDDLPDTMPGLARVSDDVWIGGRIGGDLPDTMPGLEPSPPPQIGPVEPGGAWVFTG